MGKKESAESLTYDPVDNLLMWTDGVNQSIRRIKVGDPVSGANAQNNASIEVLHFLDGDKPRGLVCDPCTRLINRNKLRIFFPLSHFLFFRANAGCCTGLIGIGSDPPSSGPIWTVVTAKWLFARICTCLTDWAWTFENSDSTGSTTCFMVPFKLKAASSMVQTDKSCITVKRTRSGDSLSMA